MAIPFRRKGKEPRRNHKPVAPHPVPSTAVVEPIKKPEQQPLDYKKVPEYSKRLVASYGKEYLEQYTTLMMRLAEYDQLIAEGVFDMNEVISYLESTGELEECSVISNIMAHVHSDRIINQVSARETPGRQVALQRKKIENANELKRVSAADRRPLFQRILEDGVFESFSSLLKQYLDQIVNNADDFEPAVREALQAQLKQNPFALEETLYAANERSQSTVKLTEEQKMRARVLFDFVSAVRIGRQWQRHPEQHALIDPTEEERQADEYAILLKHLLLTPTDTHEQASEKGHIPLPVESPIPWIKGMYINVKPSMNVTTSAYIHVLVELDQRSQPSDTIFELSRITGDLVYHGSMLTSAQDAFDILDSDAVYHHIRHLALKGVYDALGAGILTEVNEEDFVVPQTGTNDPSVSDLNEDMEPLHTAPLDELPAEQQLAPMEEDEMGALPDWKQYVTPPSDFSAQTPQEPLMKKPTSGNGEKKPRLPKVLDYGKVRSALERLGVVFSGGGRHPKMTFIKEGRQITFPFLGSHAHEDGRLVRAVTHRALVLMGISVEDFLIEY